MRRRTCQLIRVICAGAMAGFLALILLLVMAGGSDTARVSAGTSGGAEENADARLILSVSGSYTVFLPVVFGPQPQPPPPPIANGDFESGRVGWREYSATNQVLIRSAWELPVAPYAGQWTASLGNRNNEVSLLSQGVAIPPDRACLVYWQWIVSSDSCNVDFGGVGVDGKWVKAQSLCAGTSTARWVRQQVSMTKYVTTPITPTVVLNFAVTTDYSLPSSLSKRKA